MFLLLFTSLFHFLLHRRIAELPSGRVLIILHRLDIHLLLKLELWKTWVYLLLRYLHNSILSFSWTFDILAGIKIVKLSDLLKAQGVSTWRNSTARFYNIYFNIYIKYYISCMQFSLFGSILNFGSMLGAIASGKLADLMGRKLVSSSFTLKLQG